MGRDHKKRVKRQRRKARIKRLKAKAHSAAKPAPKAAV